MRERGKQKTIIFTYNRYIEFLYGKLAVKRCFLHELIQKSRTSECQRDFNYRLCKRHSPPPAMMNFVYCM